MAAAPSVVVARRPRGVAVTAAVVAVALITGVLGIRPAAAAPLDVFSIQDVTRSEGSGGGTTAFTFTVHRASGTGPASATFTTSNGTASAPGDYATTSGTLNFSNSDQDEDITVNVVADTTDEPNETFNVTITPEALATCQGGDCTAAGTIVDDDGPPIRIDNPPAVTEGQTGTTMVTFTVSVDRTSPDPVSVTATTSDGTATSADSDYVSKTAVVTIPANQSSATFTVTVNGDTKDEDNENFFVNLTSPSGGSIADAQGEASIANDDTAPQVSAGDVTVFEHDGTAQVPISLSAQSGKTVTVKYSTSNGTATQPGDYTAVTNGTVTFAPGQQNATAPVAIVNDPVDEADTEQFTVTLSAPNNASIDDGTALVSITDDDGAPVISIGDANANETSGLATFTVSLTNASAVPVTVDYATTKGSAAETEDYTPTSGTLTFDAGVTSAKIDVPIVNDTRNELSETFTVDLSSPNHATVSDGHGLGTITDDDPLPTISIDDVTHNEGNAATTAFTFTVSLSAASGRTITVQYATADATATAPGDYAAKSGTLTFFPDTVSQQVTVNVAGDAVSEPTETFAVNLSGPTAATVVDAQGIGTITNDDPGPEISINDAAVVEGSTGQTTAIFTVSLSSPSSQSITVPYSTVDGTATAGSDYVGATSSVTFVAGDQSEQIFITVNGDTVPENSETFTVHLGTPTGGPATYGDPDGLGTITTDDGPAPTLSIDDVSHAEGNTGTTAYTFTVTRVGNLGGTVLVDYTTADVSATAPADYALKSGTLTFNPTVATQTITVDVVGETTFEPDEAFKVLLSNPRNATITDNEGAGAISNDDGQPTIAIDDVSLAEGSSGTTPFTFTLSLSNRSSSNITVDVATALGTAEQADFTAISPARTVTIPAGSLSTTVTVDVTGDTTDEDDETFFVNLTAPANATTPDPQGLGTIVDDDNAPAVTITAPTVSEGDSATTNAVFTVSLSQASEKTITVRASTADGTAMVADADYTAKTQDFTFDPGETSKTFTVLVTGDTKLEPDETFTAALSLATGVSSTGPAGTATITNDDAVPSVSAGDVTIVEGNTSTVDATFTLTLSNPSSTEVTVSVATADGTATAGDDYTALGATTVTFAAGTTTQTVTTTVNGDTLDELDETFFLDLSSPSVATIADSQGTATITDDDGEPTLSINDVTTLEGNSGTTNATFTVTLSVPSGQTVTVAYATANGSATAADYTSSSGTLTFDPGDTSEPIAVPILGDTVDEVNETYTVVLSSPVNATITDGNGAGTITDDDVSMSIDDVTVTEADGPATFKVTLSSPSTSQVTVLASTANGTAAAPADYTAFVNQLVTFAAGQTSKDVVVTVKGDSRDEANETFFVNLSGATNAAIADAQGQGTITDNDPTPTIGIADVAVAEGNAGTVNASFVVTLSSQSDSVVTVQASTADGSATQPGDYAATGPVTVTFNPGEQSQSVIVPVKGDVLDEANETFALNLSSPSGGGVTVSDAQGIATITDDDGAPTVSIADATTTEGNSAPVTAGFNVSLSNVSGQAVTVGYSTANGTATAGSDYTAASGTVTFAAGETSKTVAISVAGDTTDEPNETFTVTLANATNATITRATATGTINDDDEPAPKAAQGYSLVGEDGALYAFGSAKSLGDMRGTRLNAPIIGVAYTPGGNGYWLVARDGGIFTFGDAEFHGSMGDQKLNSPIIGMAATPSGKGYWLFAGDGGIFTFGDAAFFGSMGDKKLNAPVINMEPLKSGNGYWLVAADGGIFSFGAAQFFGSMGGQRLNQPVFDMTSSDTDGGYWLVARDGGIFSFGDSEAKFFGSAVNETPRPTRVIGMDATPDSQGYWIADATGKIYRFGDAEDLGDRAASANPAPMVGFAAVRAR